MTNFLLIFAAVILAGLAMELLFNHNKQNSGRG